MEAYREAPYGGFKMKMPPFKVLSPKSLDEALDMSKELSESGEDFDWIAFGSLYFVGFLNLAWCMHPRFRTVSEHCALA